jgi:Zn-finger nucleic acid-binding protein
MLIVFGATVLILFFVGKYKSWPAWFFGGKNAVDNEGGLLLAFYTRGNAIFRLSSGEQAGNSYKVFETVPDPMAGKISNAVASGAVIYAIDLDFNTQAHIIGVGKSTPADRTSIIEALHDYKMEKVELEGDFSDYFDVFCAPGQQVQVRYVFNPEGMATFEKYVKDNCWEVVGDQLYVVGNAMQALQGSLQGDDVIAESSTFIQSVSPAIKGSLPGAPVKHEASYGDYNGPVLNCPTCQKPMAMEHNIHVCPDGHGILISGRELLQLHDGSLKLQVTAPRPQQHGALMCPFCKHEMLISNYLEGKTVIDSCPNCTFRWLDADEVLAVMPKSDEAT